MTGANQLGYLIFGVSALSAWRALGSTLTEGLAKDL